MSNNEAIFEEALNNQLSTISNRCREILIDEIGKDEYDKYDPVSYRRTFQLRDNVRTDIKDGILYVYINTGSMHYEDFHGNDVTNKVPYWINYGHNSERHQKFMLFQYPSRNFILEAKNRIEKELGLEVEIMNSYK